MLLTGATLFGNSMNKSSFEIIKDTIWKQYEKQKFEDNIIFGDITENGLETLIGYNIDSDGVYVFYHVKDEVPYSGKFYNRIENGEMKNGKLIGKYKKSFMDGRIITRSYENGKIIKLEKSKELKVLNSDEGLILENEYDCTAFVYPDFIYKFENKKLNEKVKAKRCSFELKNGKLHGKYLAYYEDTTQKHFELNYKDGKRHGLMINWDKAGNVIYESIFNNGNGE